MSNTQNVIRYIERRFDEFTEIPYRDGKLNPLAVFKLYLNLFKIASAQSSRNAPVRMICWFAVMILCTLLVFPVVFSLLEEIAVFLASISGFVLMLPTTIVGVILYRLIDRTFMRLAKFVSCSENDEAFYNLLAKIARA